MVKLPAMSQNERTLTDSCRRLFARLEADGLLFAVKLHGSAGQRAGLPDYLIVTKGKQFFIELKRDDKTELSLLQRAVASQLRKLGAEVFVASSFDGVVGILATYGGIPHACISFTD